MTKRLRGWKKDVELGLAERPGAEAEDPNPFATKLLSHWAHGTLSAKAIQELAHLAQLGGTSHAEVAALAKSGNYGENPGDIHKAIMQTFLPNVSIPAGFDVEVPCLDPKTSQASTSTASIFLPHTMFSALYEHYPTKWAELFCPPKLEEFWKGVESKKDDRLKGHPLKKRENWRTQAIPIFVHGDGAEFMTRDSLMIYSFGCVLNLFGSLDSHLLMGVFPKVATTKDTWPALWKWFSWSFHALQKGFHPSRNPDGKPLEKGSPFYPHKGKALASSFTAAIWTIIGDQEFFSLQLDLPHWASKNPCHQCNCTSKSGDLPYSWLDPDVFTYVNTKVAKANPSSTHPIFSIDGVTSRMVRGMAYISFSQRDCMPICWEAACTTCAGLTQSLDTKWSNHRSALLSSLLKCRNSTKCKGLEQCSPTSSSACLPMKSPHTSPMHS
jgi:hypothetical protein